MEVGESYPDETVEKEADISIHEEKEKRRKQYTTRIQVKAGAAQ